MIVKNIVSSCWLASSDQVSSSAARVAEMLAASSSETELFFRADDIGVPGHKCRAMMETFRENSVPLYMAVTPAWLSEDRWEALKEWAGDGHFIWHQHGWRHVSHQLSGKKGEFGTDRTREAKAEDIRKGRDKLHKIMGDQFRPIFTPPWNRIDGETAELLAELGFWAVSRWQNENKKVPLPQDLPDISVNVDLHTRTESDPEVGLAALEAQFATAIESGRVGVMLHHQRMNDAALVFLDSLLHAITDRSFLDPFRLNPV